MPLDDLSSFVYDMLDERLMAIGEVVEEGQLIRPMYVRPTIVDESVE